MIRINLVSAQLPPPHAESLDGEEFSLPTAELQKQGFLRLLLILVFPVGLWVYEQQTIPELVVQRDERARHFEELRSYNAKAAKSVLEIKKFKEDEARLQARITFLDRLARERLREIKVVDLVQQMIPEKVWLTRLDVNNGKLTLAGMATSDYEISGFMEGLAKSVHFVDVNLASSTDQMFEGLSVKKFELVCLMERRVQ